MSVNLTIVQGNLLRDPEVRFTGGGTAVCNCGIAVHRTFKDKGGEPVDRTLFLEFAIFGPRGEAFAKFHKKGSQTIVEGFLEQDEWEDKATGQKRTRIKLVVNQWHFIGSKANSANDPTPASSGPDDAAF